MHVSRIALIFDEEINFRFSDSFRGTLVPLHYYFRRYKYGRTVVPVLWLTRKRGGNVLTHFGSRMRFPVAILLSAKLATRVSSMLPST